LLGSAIAGTRDRSGGAIIGALGGAVVGNQLTRPNADCAHAYGYYDRNGYWHANAIDRANAAGYFDRDGNWVDGAPNGYYDAQGRWVAANTAASASGYYDSNGLWVPASAQGYYNGNGQWVPGVASGYYATYGRWIPGPVTGYYDDNGRWISGQPKGHRDSSGVWIADPPTGHYSPDGRWRPGSAVGYYDTQGRWIATASGSSREYDRTDDSRTGGYAGYPEFRPIEAHIQDEIASGVREDLLEPEDAASFSQQLQDIQGRETREYRMHGRSLPDNDRAQISSQLDDLDRRVDQTRNEP